MSVIAYACPVHGHHGECDTASDGERICPEGEATAVSGITGHATFSGDGPANWRVDFEYPKATVTVTAWTVDEALTAAIEQAKEEGVYEPGKRSPSHIQPA
jgi:hypothetical protein